MLRNEAIRLASRQEQNHDSFDSSHQPVASTHDRRDMRMHLRLLADLLGLAPFAAQELKSRLA